MTERRLENSNLHRRQGRYNFLEEIIDYSNQAVTIPVVPCFNVF
jgi:hypothetical protein